MPIINLIAAIDRNRAIGYHGDQLVYISQDLQHFKALTLGKTVIMGRRTNEALPKRKLPGRCNVVLTRDSSFSVEGVDVATSLAEALQMVEAESEVFVIGGAQAYEAFLPHASRLFLTVIDCAFPHADTFFPPFSQWHSVAKSEVFTDPKSGLHFWYETFEK